MAQDCDVSVSVGMPVYNGERYIAQAIDSVLQQSFENLSLVICDNKSTDATGEICRRYAEADSRVTYVRNPENIGCNPNFNKTFALSSGEYFMWLAHDDFIERDFITQCLERLERSPELGLCHAAVRMIDERGSTLGVYGNEMTGTTSPRPHRRLRSVLLEDPYCQSVFGLCRAAVLRKTNLLGSHHNSDRVLLAEMALLAPFGYLEKPLFANRFHDQRYTARMEWGSWSSWHDPLAPRKRQFPLWRSYGRYLEGIGTFVPSCRDRLLCYLELVRWWFVGANTGYMLLDAVSAYEPRVFTWAQSAKHHFFGSRADWLVARRRRPTVIDQRDDPSH